MVAYGIPLQPGVNNDKTFIKSHLAEQYGITGANISNVRRLLGQPLPTERSGTSGQEPTHNQPPPILFSVPNLNLKRRILQKSYELRQEIQFRADASREDREKRKALSAELRRRIELGEPNLAIHRGKIVPKNLICLGGSYPHQPINC